MNKYTMKRYRIYDEVPTEGVQAKAHELVDSYVIDVIKRLPDKQIYSKLRRNEDFEIIVPDIYVTATYNVNQFVAIVPREKVEEIAFGV